MKIHVKIFCSLLLFIPFICNGQTGDEVAVVDIKYWTENGDTVSTRAIYINQYNFQFNLVTCDTAGKPMSYLSPKEVAGFIYKSGNEFIEFNSLQNPDDMGRLFLRVVYRGKYILYQLLNINYASPTLTYQASYYLWDQKLIDPPITLKFEKESLLHHFSNCPELEYKIKTGEYGLPQIKSIIMEFENCQLTDAYEFFYE